VPRTALLARLAAPRPDKLTLVAAPPGWGKTTLVAAWQQLQDEERPFVWFSLDAGDNDPVRFWTYVVEGLRAVQEDVGTEVLGLLRAPGVRLLEGVVPTLVADLERLARPVVVVLDDYHLIDDADVHESVEFLLEHLPPALHLVLASRSDPPLRLARLRARGELLELRAAELRFGERETELFLNGVLGLGLDAADVARLHDRTEGWAAGLYLAALSLRGRADAHAFIEAFAGDDRHVVDYLVSEVLDREPPDRRDFLLRTSILGPLCGPLCDAVLETQDAASSLEQLERSNLFLVPLDTRREWYRYHQLFQDLLLHELQRADPELAPELHRRASEWHRDHGLASEAIHHAIAGGDADAACDLIAAHWNAFFNLGRLATVSGWLEALPANAVASDPHLCIARAWLALDLGRVQEVEDWIRAAEESTPPAALALRAETAVLRTVHRFKIGDVGRAYESARETLALAPSKALFPRTAASCILGITQFLSGEPERAVEVLGEAVRLARSAGNDLAACYALGYLSVLHAERGELDLAAELSSTALALSDEPGFAEHFTTMMAHLGLAKVHGQRAELADSEAAAARALELGRRGAGRLETAAVLFTLADVRRARGAADEASALLDEARKTVASSPDPGTLAEMLARTQRGLSPGPVRPAELGDELTEREFAVLRLLATNLSQREIGAALYVSLNTVKTHTRGIFRKLGASSRGEAVERARSRSLL